MFNFLVGLRAAASGDGRRGTEPRHPNNEEYMTAYGEAQLQSDRCRAAVGRYPLLVVPPQTADGGNET
jgi:hypothetical protein